MFNLERKLPNAMYKDTVWSFALTLNTAQETNCYSKDPVCCLLSSKHHKQKKDDPTISFWVIMDGSIPQCQAARMGLAAFKNKIASPLHLYAQPIDRNLLITLLSQVNHSVCLFLRQ